ncbi:amino acid ABC transporter permease [Micromonospora echinofusca]|uniref:ABC transporter permease subunit n=1 Tax=Micromonospora echinofusca TaxID=47858 RepID=A0ABS3VZH0_MICEH|nr:amino acid ABC transporter permease [Micromonospora echinofusca]MBO4209833.1 ABC transporter permease subunit [Micromonospora echinofusca]
MGLAGVDKVRDDIRTPGGPPLPVKVVPVRHPGRWIVSAVLLVLAAMMVNSLLTNPAWDWPTVGEYLFSRRVLDGLVLTVMLTVAAMLMGIVLGVAVAMTRLSGNPVLRAVAWLYAWFFRGTPVLVQIIFWSFIGFLYPVLSLGIPFGPEFVYFDANALIPIVVGGLLGLGLNEAAYMSEIVRAGILSVDRGQTEAAQALGMTRATLMRRIVLPQAMRVILPPTGNQTISMLKTTSLLSVIAVGDLFTTVQLIYGSNYRQIPLLVVASLWYLALTSLLSVGQYFIERRFARSS